MAEDIYSMAFPHDNQSVFISDFWGNIKMIKWQPNANSGNDFDFSEEPKMIGNTVTKSICLTKDEKYLLVGSSELVSVFETETREVTKEFKLKDDVIQITLIQDGKKAIIAEEYGDLSILDLETLEISSVAKNITNGNFLTKFILI